MYFAQVDKDGMCKAVTESVKNPVMLEGEEFIEINDYDISLLGKKRVGSNWVNVVTPVTPIPTKLEDIDLSKPLTRAADELIKKKMVEYMIFQGFN